MKFSVISNQGNSNVHMKLGTFKEGYETRHFQSGKFTWDLALPISELQIKIGTVICSSETGYFQTGKFMWNLALPRRDSQMFIWNPSRKIHMKFGTSKQRNSYEIWQFEMKLCTSKQGISYEIWHFQTWKFNWNLALPIREIQMFIWNRALPNKECR